MWSLIRFKNIREAENAEGMGFISLDTAPSIAAFSENSPPGARQGGRAFFAGAGKPLRKTLAKDEKRRIKAVWGGLFFGFFLLAVQKKETRLSGRQIGRMADLQAEHPQGETHGCVS